MRINACVATSARSVRVRRLSSGSAAAATAKIVVNTMKGSRFPSTAARTGLAGISSTMNRAPVGICSAACRTNPESADAARRSAACCFGVMAANGRHSAATPNPITIAASVVPQKNPSVRMPSRPTRRRSPSPATPANSAVPTSGITTIESRLRNSVPNGRSHWPVIASKSGDRVTAATRPRASPATSPTAIHTWILIDRPVLFPAQ